MTTAKKDRVIPAEHASNIVDAAAKLGMTKEKLQLLLPKAGINMGSRKIKSLSEAEIIRIAKVK